MGRHARMVVRAMMGERLITQAVAHQQLRLPVAPQPPRRPATPETLQFIMVLLA